MLWGLSLVFILGDRKYKSVLLTIYIYAIYREFLF
jgi:hypothetical protein